MSKLLTILALVAGIAAAAYFGLGSEHSEEHGHSHEEEGHGDHGGHGGHDDHGAAAEEFERGPNRGRLLRDGDFSLEITIFEDGVPPQFHLYAYEDDKPIDPKDVQVTITLSRLDGEVNSIHFAPKEDFLAGNATVVEPHSFDVKVDVNYKGQAHTWEFSSYEGRVTIAKESAESAGIRIETAGPGTIRETLSLSGRITLNPNRLAQVKARFPGVVREMRKNLGDKVATGDVLAMVESNDSLQVYPVKAPIGGTILERNLNVGDVAGDTPLYQIADLSTMWVELHLFPRDISKVKPGQKVHVKSMEGNVEAEATITAVPPVAQATSQSVLARVTLDNSEGQWRSGMAVRGDVTIAEREAPITVKASGLQAFRDFTVVFAQVGETYEVRMLELGLNDGERVEVLGGIKPGTPYVSENSYLIKADIEKSGASHDH